MCHCETVQLRYLTNYYRITLHNKGDNHCEVIKHCIKPKATLKSTTDTAHNSTFENTTNLETNLTGNATAESNKSSGATIPMTDEVATKKPDEVATEKPSDEPTKKATEKRSTDIIDILIGSRRRRGNRKKKVSHTSTFNFKQIIL